MLKCSSCEKKYPKEFSGNLCPFCEDKLYEARIEMMKLKKMRGDE